MNEYQYQIGKSFPPSNEFIIERHIQLDPQLEIQLRKYLNLHYLGDEDCNHLVDGQMVAKYPEKETKEYQEASRVASVGFYVSLKVTFDVNGIPTAEVIK